VELSVFRYVAAWAAGAASAVKNSGAVKKKSMAGIDHGRCLQKPGSVFQVISGPLYYLRMGSIGRAYQFNEKMRQNPYKPWGFSAVLRSGTVLTPPREKATAADKVFAGEAAYRVHRTSNMGNRPAQATTASCELPKVTVF
jgi:hypothetical protein